jgi:hypothetical protein
MSTEMLGNITSDPRATPAARRHGVPICPAFAGASLALRRQGRSAGAKTRPNRRSSVQNKPNFEEPKITLSTFQEEVYPINSEVTRLKKQTQSNPIAAGVLIQPLALSAAQAKSNGEAQRSRTDLPTPLHCHQSRRTNPIVPVPSPKTRVGEKNKANQSQCPP